MFFSQISFLTLTCYTFLFIYIWMSMSFVLTEVIDFFALDLVSSTAAWPYHLIKMTKWPQKSKVIEASLPIKIIYISDYTFNWLLIAYYENQSSPETKWSAAFINTN